jgi:DNA primase
MSVVDEIKARIDIVDLVSETVQLRRSGKNYTGFCPFHPNQRTPAFAVFSESGTWRCFGQCNEGGDIFRFVMKKEGCDFSEALRILAERAGVQLKPPSPEEQAQVEEHDALRSLLEEAVIFYRHQLLNTSEGKLALEYLRQKRGLQDQTLEAFGVGYAPHAWEAALSHFTSKGVSVDDLLAVGLVTEREPGLSERKAGKLRRADVYDRFRRRIMFPIRDERARMAGFGARILDPDDIPKFLNSPQTPIFDKGRLLYGLDRARKSIRTLDQAVIVEGYLDVIALHQGGFENAISPMGTALTEHQLYLLKRFSRRIVLALDADAAGDKATLRGLQIARQAMDRQQDPVFDARGLLGYESRLQADIRVTTLPAGMDPDEVVNRDPQEWQRILDKARPIVLHVMETLAAGRDLNDPKVKTEIAAQVIPLIEDVPSPIERDTYRQSLARLLHVDERTLMEALPSQQRGRPRPRRRPAEQAEPAQAAPALAAAKSGYALELHCLGLLMRNPDLIYQVDRRLQQEKLPRLSVDDFEHAEHKAILRLFQDSLDQDIAEPQTFVFNSLSLTMMEVADDLLARTAQLDPNQERVLEDLMRGLLDLRRRKLHQEIEYQRYLIEEAQEQGDLRATQYSQNMVQLAEVKRRVDQAIKKYTSRSLAARQNAGKASGS